MFVCLLRGAQEITNSYVDQQHNRRKGEMWQTPLFFFSTWDLPPFLCLSRACVLHHLWLRVLLVLFYRLLLLALVIWTLLDYPLASCLPWCYAWYFDTYFPSSRVWLVLAKLASPQAQKSWMPVMTLILFLPSQLCAFLALFLPFLSHLSFSSIIVWST